MLGRLSHLGRHAWRGEVATPLALMAAGLAWALAEAAPGAVQPPAGTPAAELLARCLASPAQPFPPEARVVPPPPGLTQDDRMVTALTPAAGDRVFVFRGAGPQLACGIAVYGPVAASTRDEVVAVLDSQAGWRRRAPLPTVVADPVPERRLYWEDARAPGLAGAAMAQREPTPERPTLEVAAWRELVR